MVSKLSEDIKQIRLLKGMTRQEVCDLARVSMNALRHLETDGKANIRTLVQVLLILGKKDWLLNLAPVISINPLDMNRKRGKKNSYKRRSYQPPWLTEEQKNEIKSLYLKAKEMTKVTGIRYVVDHIIPVLGKNMSGLHVPWNLQIITLSENSKKNNRVNL